MNLRPGNTELRTPSASASASTEKYNIVCPVTVKNFSMAQIKDLKKTFEVFEGRSLLDLNDQNAQPSDIINWHGFSLQGDLANNYKEYFHSLSSKHVLSPSDMSLFLAEGSFCRTFDDGSVLINFDPLCTNQEPIKYKLTILVQKEFFATFSIVPHIDCFYALRDLPKESHHPECKKIEINSADDLLLLLLKKYARYLDCIDRSLNRRVHDADLISGDLPFEKKMNDLLMLSRDLHLLSQAIHEAVVVLKKVTAIIKSEGVRKDLRRLIEGLQDAKKNVIMQIDRLKEIKSDVRFWNSEKRDTRTYFITRISLALVAMAIILAVC